MFTLFKFILGIVFMLLLAVLALPFIIPPEQFRAEILAQIQQKTGREVLINGELDFSLYPSLSLNVSDIVVVNPKGSFLSPHFAKVKELAVEVALMPLLSKRIEAQGIRITSADIYLEESVGKQNNWQFGAPKESAGGEPHVKVTQTAFDAQAAENEVDPVVAAKPASRIQFTAQSILIEDSQLHYIKPSQQIIAREIALEYTPESAQMRAVANLGGINYHFKANTKQPLALFSAEPLPLTMSMNSPLANAQLTGTLAGVNLETGEMKPQFNGTLNSKVSGWAASTTGIWPLTLQSREFRATQSKIELGMLTMTAGNVEDITGNLAVLLQGDKPLISGSLSASTLDITPFMQEASLQVTPSKASFFQRSFAALLPSAYAQAAESGWSKEPIDLAGLGAVNAELVLQCKQLVMPDYTLSPLRLQVNLRDSVLNLPSITGGIGGGSFNGAAQLDARKPVIQWSQETSLKNIAFADLTKPYLKNLAVSGATNGKISLRGAGRSIHDWMRSLNGGGNVAVTNGEVSGYSLPKLFRAAKASTGDVATSLPAEVTPFKSITAAFSADSGVLSLREGGLESDKLRATMTGNVSLIAKQVNLRLVPEIVPQVTPVSEEAMQAEGLPLAPVSGLKIPLNITGSFDAVKIRPDYAGAISEALKNPEDLKKTLKNFKQEGKAIEDSFEPTKDALKDSWKDLKENKNPAAVGNILNQLKGLGIGQ